MVSENGDPVFKRVPRIYRFRSDLKRAGTPYKGRQNRQYSRRRIQPSAPPSFLQLGSVGGKEADWASGDRWTKCLSFGLLRVC
jgi:hypothetical protein